MSPDFNSLKMKGIILIIKQYFWSLLFESICALQFGYWAFFTGNIDLNNRALIIFPFTICILFVTLVKISTSFIDWKFKVLNIMETVNRKTGDGSVS